MSEDVRRTLKDLAEGDVHNVELALAEGLVTNENLKRISDKVDEIISKDRFAREREVPAAYEHLKSGKLWKEHHAQTSLSAEQPDVRQLSKLHVQRLKEALGDLQPHEKELVARIQALPFAMVHDTNYYGEVSKTNEILSYQRVKEARLKDVNNKPIKHNTPRKNVEHLANEQFVFFRFTPSGEKTVSRFGQTSIVMDPEKANLFIEGWVSLHDMLSPLPDEPGSRLAALLHDGEQFGRGTTYRISKDADTDPDRVAESAAHYRNQGIDAHIKTLEGELKSYQRKIGQAGTTEPHRREGGTPDSNEQVGVQTRVTEARRKIAELKAQMVDLATWRANPGLADKVQHTYPQAREGSSEAAPTRTVALASEVFFGEDILLGIALSVVLECRNMGPAFQRIVIAKGKDPAFLQDLLAHLYRIEAKLPSRVRFRDADVTIRHGQQKQVERHEADGTFDDDTDDEVDDDEEVDADRGSGVVPDAAASSSASAPAADKRKKWLKDST